MEYQLPTEFDLIVLGTGMVESIIAAAASRIGKRVLHIDSNNYYGGLWASFGLDVIDKIDTKSTNTAANNLEELINETEKLYHIGNNSYDIIVHSKSWHIPEKPKLESPNEEQKSDIETTNDPIESEEEWSQEKLLNLSKKFNIDIAPKLHFARGEFVELLISSNIARYSEFRSVSRVLTLLNGQLEVVPCSRSDVFSSTKVSVIEKRMLMKLLSACMDGSETEFMDYSNKTFKNYLKDKKLTENLVHYVLYAIAMVTDNTPCLEGVAHTKRFLSSLGRFGKTPFLYSMYGSGEITQAFCRLSAVFGGVYALNQPLDGLVLNENKFQSILTNQQRINANSLVMGVDNLPAEFAHVNVKEYISRAIFITDGSLMEGEKEHLTLLLFPPLNGKHRCTIIEVGSLTGTCPKDLYIVHMYTKQSENPKADLEHCVNALFSTKEESKELPSVLWSLYFTVPNAFQLDNTSNMPENVFVCPGPDLDLDYDNSVQQAKDIFKAIYPDLEFLPRAPDPEEIVIEGEDDNNENTLEINSESQS